jgi:hypothetical protein
VSGKIRTGDGGMQACGAAGYCTFLAYGRESCDMAVLQSGSQLTMINGKLQIETDICQIGIICNYA